MWIEPTEVGTTDQIIPSYYYITMIRILRDYELRIRNADFLSIIMSCLYSMKYMFKRYFPDSFNVCDCVLILFTPLKIAYGGQVVRIFSPAAGR